LTVHQFHSIIVGGGAAGFFAAVNAARLAPGQPVAILEKTNKLLSKVRVSGGGRCNVTHACFDPRELWKFYPRGGKELRGSFSRFNPNHTEEWFEARGVKFKTEEDGRMFPVTDNSETIVNCLLAEAERYGVEILAGHEVISIEKTGGCFQLNCENGKQFSCKKLLIASGGHAKSAAYEFIRETGHKIEDPVPSLFTFNMPGNRIIGLMGVSVENASVKIEGTPIETSGPLLITHWGMSGPAILKASAWGARTLAEKNYQFNALISWLPGKNEEAVREMIADLKMTYASRQLINTSFAQIPKRLWYFLLVKAGVKEELRWADLSKKESNQLLEVLIRDRYPVAGKTTFKEEFVTCGGVSLSEVDMKTMESRKLPGLYFAGEVLDIDGVTGGFNFQAAWTTGWLAANAMAAEHSKE
jgi:hypothetical protein